MTKKICYWTADGDHGLMAKTMVRFLFRWRMRSSHPANLQPLWVIDTLKKSGKLL